MSENQNQTQNIKHNIAGSMQMQPEENNNLSDKANKGKRVLIIEDDDFLRELLAHNLSDIGYKVDSARDAKMAFIFLERNIPDIILLDLMLPGMNGFDFLSKTKETQKLAVPVIILSNLGKKEDIDMALSLGAVDFIVKANVTPKQITGKVQEVLENGGV